MRTPAILLAAVLGIAPAAPAGSQTVNWNQIKGRCSRAIVRVNVVIEEPDLTRPYLPGSIGRASGTGFFVTDQHIVTNHHVVDGSREITIQPVYDKEHYKMRRAARPCPEFDLALLEFASPEERTRFIEDQGAIEALGWAPDFSGLPGEEVAALGFGDSDQLVATRGIVSSWETMSNRASPYLQLAVVIRTDASINPGNSGGPSVDAEGRVIGVNSYTRVNRENVGLMIPATTAREVVEALLRTGEFVKSSLGIVYQNLTPTLRSALDLDPTQNGVVITHVFPESSAAAAGLAVWDVLSEVEGRPILYGEVAQERIGKLPFWSVSDTRPAGSTVRFTRVGPGGEVGSVDVVLQAADRRSSAWIAPAVPQETDKEWGYLGGMVITELTQNLLEKMSESRWRFELINDLEPGHKTYILTFVEPQTQASEYVTYGWPILYQRVLELDGVPLDRDLDRRLAELHSATAAAAVSVGFEEGLVLRIDLAQAREELAAFRRRYTLEAAPGPATAP